MPGLQTDGEWLPGGQVQGPSARHLRPVTGLSREYEPEITGKQANAQTGTSGQLPAALEVHRWQRGLPRRAGAPTMALVICISGGVHGACPGHAPACESLRSRGPAEPNGTLADNSPIS